IYLSVSTSVAHRSLHSFPSRRSSALSPLWLPRLPCQPRPSGAQSPRTIPHLAHFRSKGGSGLASPFHNQALAGHATDRLPAPAEDRKSTRLNSSHVKNSYAVLCLKKK